MLYLVGLIGGLVIAGLVISFAGIFLLPLIAIIFLIIACCRSARR